MLKQRTSILFLTITCVGVAACESEAPESKLETAAQQIEETKDKVADARDDYSDAHHELRERKADVESAELSLAEARKQLRRAQAQLTESRDELDRRASDTAVFRLLQGRLLDAPELETAAISVSVFEGEAVLQGSVTNDEQKRHAEAIASSTPGVHAVRNLIDTDG